MASSSNKPAASRFMPSGYEYEFVDEVPEDYICSICLSPMWKPVQTKCGHRYCKDCLNEARKSKNPPQCPEDRQRLGKQDVFEDKAAERKILSLVIKCPSDGCQWAGELGDLKDHTCTPTSREPKCDQNVKREKSTSHLTLVPCVYQRFGCHVKTPKKDMDKHILSSIGHHLNITCERLLLLEEENLQLKTSFLKEIKDERETTAKELVTVKTTLNSQKGEFSKEIKNLKKQIKQQVDEQAKIYPKNAVNAATINKDLAENTERSRLRMKTSIDELRHDFENKMKTTIDQLQRDLDERTRTIRIQMPKSDFENVDRKIKINSRIFQRYLKEKMNKLIERKDARAIVSSIILFAIFIIIKCHKEQIAAFLMEM